MEFEALPTPMDSTSSWDPPPVQGNSSRRRKIRKGTHSCWQCKRRKAKCIFSTAADDVCVGCRRRGLSCTRQDLPEELSNSKTNRPDLDERLDKVESLLSELNSKLRKDAPLAKDDDGSAGESIPDTTVALTSNGNPADFNVGAESSDPFLRGESHQAITASLLAAWPSPKDTESLLRNSHGTTLYCHHLNAGHHCRLTEEDWVTKPAKLPWVPGPEMHPVVLARRMLCCVLFLQSPCAAEKYMFSVPIRTIMHRMLTAVVGLVNGNDELHGSLESVECFMLESMYHMHYGNLRKSWLVNRRAMLLAQMIGLHHRPMPPIQSLDPQLASDPEAMWSRIVSQDRYLCLLLGLPPGSSNRCTNGPMTVPRSYCCTSRKIEASLHNIGAKILERNEIRRLDYSQDLAIDAELLQLAYNAPEGYWSAPQMDGISAGSFADALAVNTLTRQAMYYHLLNQLHWPYLLNTLHCEGHGRSTKHEAYSATTCVHASREILHRFILYRNFNSASQCFRPVDFLAITAVLTLLLAHSDIYYSSLLPEGQGKRTDYLAHQRLGDRLLLDQAMQQLETVSQYNRDATSIGRLEELRSLIRLKMEATRENNFIRIAAKPQERGSEQPQSSSTRTNEGELQFPAPYFGTIRISQGGTIFKTFSQATATVVGSSYDFDSSPEAAVVPASSSEVNDTSSGSGWNWDFGSESLNISAAAGSDKWAFQGVDAAFFDTLMMGRMPGEERGADDFST
ncbi:hypothetical protein PFICI_14727 [Pestalotiopsis fici W106-1]|uniref:Zn(2)-C6 fungal-type domain-containing protein n=1 Tax=Pestalotiopsis fici (strain W106-1 / CGMCC3.15140) TaxID=1229662 RepID=W3WLV7_PESFW|nr:uncharacterized protein PFICI_14727 [Pestalotiopsis fici W106-1]ETS73781.1 hypothetical protein PFICI_14727 [Pestalotiopsis fici W106-1]